MAQRAEKVKRYVEDQQLPIDVLIDDTRDVLRAYGVWQPTAAAGSSIVRPSLFLIDPSGQIRYAFVARMQHEFPEYEEIASQIRGLGRGTWGVGPAQAGKPVARP